MQIIKRCERCYTTISDVNTADWYSHMSIKYCAECRVIVEREKTAERVRRFRERKRQLDRERDAQLKRLEAENEILRSRIEALWDLKCQGENARSHQDVSV